MKRAALILAALAAILTAAAAPVRTATENFVTNKIAEAVAAIPAPDYSTNNTALVETIQAKAPAPGNYAVVSNAAIYAAITNALQDAALLSKLDKSGDTIHSGSIKFKQGSNPEYMKITYTGITHSPGLVAGGPNPATAFNWLDGLSDHLNTYYLPKSGGTVTGELTVQESLIVGSGSASGTNSVAEGNSTTASGNNSHAEGGGTTASGNNSHAEGSVTTASGNYSHAEGWNTTASGRDSHVEGWNTTASGQDSHAEGGGTIAQNKAEHAQGRFNDSHKASDTIGDAGNTLSSIGFGTADSARKNAVETMQDGKTFIYGLGGYDGTNPTNGVKDLVAAIEGKADAADIPPAVSNIVTTALVRERLGVYLYVGADGGIYVHTNED